jgi:hypothetical protein
MNFASIKTLLFLEHTDAPFIAVPIAISISRFVYPRSMMVWAWAIPPYVIIGPMVEPNAICISIFIFQLFVGVAIKELIVVVCF